MPKKISCAPLDFYSGVTYGFIYKTRSCAPLAFKVVNLRVSLVCAYNSTMDFVFNGGVEESSMVCRRLESVALLLLDATMVIMFLLVVIESLLKILS